MAIIIKKEKYLDIIGNEYGKLTVLEYIGYFRVNHLGRKYDSIRHYYLCKCICGNLRKVDRSNLRTRHTTSCGCSSIKLQDSKERSFNAIYISYKSTAKRRNIEFLLKKDEAKILFLGNCYYCGCEPSNGVDKWKYSDVFIYSGIDRVNNKKGYTVDNCVPCCRNCNFAKREMSFYEFRDWINLVHSTIPISPEKTIIVVQGRLASKRFPQKILKPLCGKPIILHIMDRLSVLEKKIGPIIFATANTDDNKKYVKTLLEKYEYCCEAPEVEEDDVLGRYLLIARKYQSKNIIRLTADCPCVDPELIEKLFIEYSRGGYDYSCVGGNFADGSDAEVFKMECLEWADENSSPADREHVTSSIWSNKKFSQYHLICPLDLSNERWTVDTEDDYLFIKDIYEHLYPLNPNFGWRDVYAYVQGSKLNEKYPNREKRNQAYLNQAGIQSSWEEFRFGSQ